MAPGELEQPLHVAADDASIIDGAAVAESQGVVPAVGLTDVEAARRLAAVGPNRLDPGVQTPAWRKFLAQFADPLIYLLMAAIGVSIVAWAFEGSIGVPTGAIVIAVIVIANAVLGFIQERSAEQAVAALQRMATPRARVLRNGAQREIPADEVVPGDILVLAEGDAIGADGRLLRSTSLTVAEASLTGESEPVLKDAATLPARVGLGDRFDMVFAGTAVTRGHGHAVVTATGMRTEIGRIAAMLGQTEEERTPLQREIDHVGRLLGVTVVVIAVLIIAVILVTSEVSTAQDLVEVLLIGVSLAVAAVPEGLPAIVTVILALGVQRMAQQQAIVKKLSSVETLGSASVIATDKTGTLTQNEMTIRRIVTRSGEVAVEGIGYQPVGDILSDGTLLGPGPLRDEVVSVLTGGSLANDAVLTEAGGTWIIQGDPTDAAFLVAERKLGGTEARRARFVRQGAVPFSSERRLMTSIEADTAHEGRLRIVTKGAADELVNRCTHERSGTRESPITPARRSEILASIDRLAAATLRTIGVAYRRLDVVDLPETDESLEHSLVFAGIVGMIDPPRRGVANAIREARDAGLRIIMITGDHPRTAARIATDLGIAAADDTSWATGAQIEGLDDEAFAERVRSVNVYARVAPEHKLRIVHALKADGHIVAMTGDGVNDAPALKAADIGVAMGISGTEVAKEAAKMILVDDDFATIVAAVREGRVVFQNLRKSVRYLLSSNAGEVLTMFLGVILASTIGLDAASGAVVAPLLATQILWINLLTDSAPALALGYEPAAPDVMQRRPRRLTARVIDREMSVSIVLVGAVMAGATLLALDMMLPGGLVEGSGSLVKARTAAFTVLVLAQLFNCLSARSDRRSAFHDLRGNPRLLGALALSLGLQVLVVYVPFLNRAFDTVPLSASDWVVCTILASLVLWAEELRKLVGRWLRRRPAAMAA